MIQLGGCAQSWQQSPSLSSTLPRSQNACVVWEKDGDMIKKGAMPLVVQIVLLRKLYETTAHKVAISSWVSGERSSRAYHLEPPAVKWLWPTFGAEQCSLLNRRIWKSQVGARWLCKTMYLFSLPYWETLLEEESTCRTKNLLWSRDICTPGRFSYWLKKKDFKKKCNLWVSNFETLNFWGIIVTMICFH